MKHRVFVYGSLKQGRGNHSLLLEANYIGSRLTSEEIYHMISFGAFPGVIKNSENGEAAAINGELYEVDKSTLERLDRLEANGSFYKRELVQLRDENEPAWMYILMRSSGTNTLRPQHSDNSFFYNW